MSEADRRQRAGGAIPFRLSLPNPLAWLPRPRIPLMSRTPRITTNGTTTSSSSKHQQQCNSHHHFASTSVAMSESVLGGGNSSSAAVTCSITTSTQSTLLVHTAAAAPAAAPAKVPLKPASDVLCGALARAASQSTIHPLDTLKVRIQARARVPTSSSPATSIAVPLPTRRLPPGVSKFGQLVPPGGGAPLRLADIREFGRAVGSLYKGVFGAASGAGIAIGTYFAFYGATCNVLARTTTLPSSGIAFVSGGVAAVGSSVVKVPLAVCIRSVQAGVYPNVFAAAKSIVGAAGPRGLFTGFLPTVLEDVPDMALKFAAYESMRQVHSRFHKGRPATPQEDFAMGAVAGSLAAAATTPLDVIKTNMMCTAASRPSMAGAARMVAAQGGPAAFFRGIGPRALSNGINSAVFFAFFEALRAAYANAKKAELQAVAAAVPAARSTRNNVAIASSVRIANHPAAGHPGSSRCMLSSQQQPVMELAAVSEGSAAARGGSSRGHCG